MLHDDACHRPGAMRSCLFLLLGALALACNGQRAPAEVAVTPAAPPAVPPSATPAASSPAPAAPGSSTSTPDPEPPDPAPASTTKGAPPPFERRCGWVDNPTPANWWLVDRDDTWEIGIQGGYQAEGDMPDFKTRWVETNVHYGYGCACMDMRVDRATKRVIEYRRVQVLPIDRCRKDRKLPPR